MQNMRKQRRLLDLLLLHSNTAQIVITAARTMIQHADSMPMVMTAKNTKRNTRSIRSTKTEMATAGTKRRRRSPGSPRSVMKSRVVMTGMVT